MKKSFRRDILELNRIFDFVVEFSVSARLPDEMNAAISLAVEELFCNAVRHNPMSGGDISLTLDRLKDSVHVVFKDTGAPACDITQIPEPDLTPAIDRRQPGKLGVILIRRMMDSVHYSYVDGSNIVTLRKNVGTPHA